MEELSYRNNKQSLFKKHADVLTWFSNTKVGRDYLGLNKKLDFDEKIGLFLPNGYHKILGQVSDNEIAIEANFFTRAVYAKLLYPALWNYDRLASNGIIQNFDEAKIALLMALKLYRGEDYVQRLLAQPLFFDFKPDAHPESTTVDSYLARSIGGAGEAWATMRAGAGTGAVDNDAYCYLQTGASTTTNQWTAIYRTIMLFDTSSLDDSATINTGKFLSYNAGTQAGAITVEIVASTPASNTAIAATDFVNIGSAKLADNIISTSLSAGYNTWTLATPNTTVSKTGITKLGQRSAQDIDNSQPSWTSGIAYGYNGLAADNGASTAPTLQVISSYIKTINGLANASVKTINGLARASVKTRNGLA